MAVMDRATILVKAKYQIWNEEKRPIPEVTYWLVRFLDEDRDRRDRRGPTNWSRFSKVCKEISGDPTFKVSKDEVWRSIAVSEVRQRYFRHYEY